MAGFEGQHFGKYRLLHKIAAGGMGEVHLAKLIGPAGFEKLVVIKRLLDHRQREQKYIDMFFSEARVAAQLNHSNIVQIFEVGQYDSIHYIAMEYVDGRSARVILDKLRASERSLPPEYALQVIRAACAGLNFAHNAKHFSGAPMDLVHRDINPHNILISFHSEVKIIDFGIAKSELSSQHTQAGTIKGTVVYMSPEQSNGQKIDRRSDIFSLGICLYEMLAGANPFHKDSLAASLEGIRTVAYPKLTEMRPELAAASEVVEKALARLPDDRYATCSEFADALGNLVEKNAIPKASQPFTLYLQQLFADEIVAQEQLLSQTELAMRPAQTITSTQGNSVADMLTIHSGTQQAIDLPGSLDAEPTALGAPSPEPAVDLTGPMKQILRPVENEDTTPGALALARRIWGYAQVRYSGGAVGVAAVYFLLWLLFRPGPLADIPRTELPSPPLTVPRDLVDPVIVAQGPPNLGTPPSAAGLPQHRAVPTLPAEPAAADPTADNDPKHLGLHKVLPQHHHSRPHLASETVGRFGMLQVGVEPAARVTMGTGAMAPTGPQIKLRGTSGLLRVVQSATDAAAEFYTIMVHYRVDAKGIFYGLESEPWANVYGPGGIPLGRTPLQNIAGSGATVLEFRNPSVSTNQRITLRYTAGDGK